MEVHRAPYGEWAGRLLHVPRPGGPQKAPRVVALHVKSLLHARRGNEPLVQAYEAAEVSAADHNVRVRN